VNELYNRIGQEAVDAIDDDWEEARIEFEFYGTAAHYTGRYWPADGEERDFDSRDDIAELYEQY